MLSAELKESMMDFLRENLNNFNYKVFSEITVIYATKFDEKYKEMFFSRFKDKLIKDLKFLD